MSSPAFEPFRRTARTPSACQRDGQARPSDRRSRLQSKRAKLPVLFEIGKYRSREGLLLATDLITANKRDDRTGYHLGRRGANRPEADLRVTLRELLLQEGVGVAGVRGGGIQSPSAPRDRGLAS
jgi:hypothetical protein